MPATDTLYFKQVLPNYSAWAATEQFTMLRRTTVIQPFQFNGKEKEVIPFETWTQEIFDILYRRYHNWEIAYVNPDDFIDVLTERIEIHAPNYCARKAYYQRLLSMDDTELLKSGYSINNTTYATNEKVDKPLETVLDNISDQSSYASYGDISGRIRSQINADQFVLMEDFLKKFKSLFLSLSSSPSFFG